MAVNRGQDLTSDEVGWFLWKIFPVVRECPGNGTLIELQWGDQPGDELPETVVRVPGGSVVTTFQMLEELRDDINEILGTVTPKKPQSPFPAPPDFKWDE